jgi:hypothetical protein
LQESRIYSLAIQSYFYGMTVQEAKKEKPLYSLVSLETFKALLSIDDRQNRLCRFCLETATHTIEQYCKRKLIKKSHTDNIPFYGDLFFTLNEFPVNKIFAIFLMSNEQGAMNNKYVIDPQDYYCIPDIGSLENIPYSVFLSNLISTSFNKSIIKIHYSAGYSPNNVPADLQAACFELAAWNMNRYRGKRIGMMGNIMGSGKDGEHFELAMPENVKMLLEPYRRRVI